ncbi:MAG: hypothetical protein AAGF93_07655 [Cyanobacteria bacterium P01_H01_bin.105]
MQRVALLFPFRQRVPLGDQLTTRYSQTEGQVIIPLHLEAGEDLLAPFECLRSHDGAKPLSRNLNIDLVEYLFRRVAEVDQDEMLLKISLTTSSRDPTVAVLPKQQLKTDLENLIPEHFTYLETVKRENLKCLIRDSLLLAVFGLLMLGISMLVDTLSFPEDARIFLRLLGQGITVLGWVTLWEALVNFLWTWQPIYRQLHMCQQLQQAAVKVQFVESTVLNTD